MWSIKCHTDFRFAVVYSKYAHRFIVAFDWFLFHRGTKLFHLTQNNTTQTKMYLICSAICAYFAYDLRYNLCAIHNGADFCLSILSLCLCCICSKEVIWIFFNSMYKIGDFSKFICWWYLHFLNVFFYICGWVCGLIYFGRLHVDWLYVNTCGQYTNASNYKDYKTIRSKYYLQFQFSFLCIHIIMHKIVQIIIFPKSVLIISFKKACMFFSLQTASQWIQFDYDPHHRNFIMYYCDMICWIVWESMLMTTKYAVICLNVCYAILLRFRKFSTKR